MSGPRQPIELVVAKGAKHLTKAEIDSRRKSEIAPLDGELTPPAYLSKKQTQEFVKSLISSSGSRSWGRRMSTPWPAMSWPTACISIP